VPMSGSAISAFRHHMIERWHKALMRRGQRHRLTWTRMKTIADRYLPFPRILHPWPEKRFLVTIQGRSPVRYQRTPGSARGALTNGRHRSFVRMGKTLVSAVRSLGHGVELNHQRFLGN
jgi:hypothetical protein